ncbi:MAG: hypothetical protein Q7S80_00605 [bacterium]|nr:hypothetical protein [bacterium]
MDDSDNSGGYGKRSVWSWIGIYVVVAIIAYGAIYLIYKKINANNASDSGSTQSTSLY